MKERKAENRPVVRPGAVGWILEGAALLVLLADFSFTAWGTFALPEMPPEFFEFRGGGSMASLRAGLWVLPAVALLSYLLLTWLTSIPHRLPYPRPVTGRQPAEAVYDGDPHASGVETTGRRIVRLCELQPDRLGFRSAGHGCLYVVCAGAGCRGDSGRRDYQDGCRPVRIAAVAGMRSAEGRMKEMRELCLSHLFYLSSDFRFSSAGFPMQSGKRIPFSETGRDDSIRCRVAVSG